VTATLRLWLRRERWAVLGWTIGVAVVVALVTIAWVVEAGTPQEAARFAAILQPVALSMEPILGDAQALDTAGGFITWRALGALPLILGVFSLLLAVRMTAGEEARGTADLALSTPLARVGYMLGLGAALLVCDLVVGGVGLAVGVAGANLGGGGLRIADGIWQGLGIGLIAWVWAACAGLIAQRARSRVAARAFTALLMVACFLITNLSRTSSFFAPLRWISPFTAYRASRPLVPGWGVDIPALVVLLLVGLGLWGVATMLFTRRDLGVGTSRVRTPRRRVAAAGPRLRLRDPLLRDLWSLVGVTTGWTIGLAAFSSLMVVIEPTIRKPIQDMLDNAGSLGMLFAGDLMRPGFLASIMFGTFAAPALAAYTVLQVGRWATELQEGLPMLSLSTTLGRSRLALSRIGAVLIAGAVAMGVSCGVILIVGEITGTHLGAAMLGRVTVAVLALVFVFFALGMAVGTWVRPSWAAPVVGGLAVADFVSSLVVPLLHLPTWVAGISIFSRYGDPVIEGLRWSHQGVLVGLGALLTVLAVFGFRRQDLVW